MIPGQTITPEHLAALAAGRARRAAERAAIPQATCHPKRKAVEAGLCLKCIEKAAAKKREEAKETARLLRQQELPDVKKRIHQLVGAAVKKAKQEEPLFTQMATCHPTRKMIVDGLCQHCVTKRARRHAVSPQEALSRVQAAGEGKFAKRVKAYLQHNLEEYAELHIEAARIAATKGDGKPAEWALQTIKIGDGPLVSVPTKDGQVGTGIKVLIGVNLGGLPPQTVTIEGEKVE